MGTWFYWLSESTAWSNTLIIAGFTAIAVGIGCIYWPAGIVAAGILAVLLAKLMQSAPDAP